jgi:hypothetical protein
MQAIIKVKNGYWTYNGKPLSRCTFPERQIVSQFIKNYIFSIDVPVEMELVEDECLLKDYDCQLEFVKLLDC